LGKSVISNDIYKSIKNNSNYNNSIIEKTTQANSCDNTNVGDLSPMIQSNNCDISNADDLYQMIQDNMKEMDEIKNMLTTMWMYVCLSS